MEEARPRRATVSPETIVEFLAGTALFQGCERKTVEKIVPHVFPVQVPGGSVVVRAGTPDPGIGFLYQGRAAVRRTDAATGAQVTLEEVAVGDPFGEIGAFLGTTQPYDVIAVDDSVMFLLGHDVVMQLATKVAAFSFAAARRLASKAVAPPVAPPRRIDSASETRPIKPTLEVVQPEQLVYDIADQEREPRQTAPIGDEVVALANRLIAHAIDRGASDVHVDHGANGPRVRFRVQGQLHGWDHAVPASHGKSLVARLKVLAGLDVTERRLPQDGRLGVRVGRREIDIRISTLPTSRGEKVALRVFEGAARLRPLEAIFHDPAVLEAVRAALQRPYGAIVVAGPAGSGKTSTLYAALGERIRTRPDTNALTVEDPIEYRLAGVPQVQVNHAVELGFAEALRAMLRQDSDVIMVDEVRDEDTARLALEAAMTGHLMLTSLHASNAAGVVQRLGDLGCGRPLIGQSLALALVQRLARRLCPRCATAELPPPIVVENLAAHGLADRRAPSPLPRAVGCPECGQTGYAGRVAIVEMLLLDDALRAQITAGVPLAELERAAIESGALITFRSSALQLMANQIISPAEVLLTLA